MEVSAHRPLHHTCLRACCTRVVQQDDHVVPGQAVFRFEHGGVPPRVQSVDVSVLVGILSQQEERAMTHSASLLLLSILDQLFFSLHFLLILFKEAPGKQRRESLTKRPRL